MGDAIEIPEGYEDAGVDRLSAFEVAKYSGGEYKATLMAKRVGEGDVIYVRSESGWWTQFVRKGSGLAVKVEGHPEPGPVPAQDPSRDVETIAAGDVGVNADILREIGRNG